MADLDPVIHAEARLRVVASLATLGPKDQMLFTRLQEILSMTPGNLSTHLRKLEDAGYVEVTKAQLGRKPATYLALTQRGRGAFETYRASLAALLENTEPSA
ncbi:winged helix DNA-binding protein [Antricoccus suffuscus]|uniref:Winged helix DNA-binding protein n=1 Tax=Antricoccus suffuscus TaxID=1629062 RepID=A0A2T0ZY54_9ACTN|nr:transcriptional regulator [Antricoccus suffuscus]PRZ41289.1 winged helix DNA-binding protein [Antricoccus suffuscus]